MASDHPNPPNTWYQVRMFNGHPKPPKTLMRELFNLLITLHLTRGDVIDDTQASRLDIPWIKIQLENWSPQQLSTIKSRKFIIASYFLFKSSSNKHLGRSSMEYGCLSLLFNHLIVILLDDIQHLIVSKFI